MGGNQSTYISTKVNIFSCNLCNQLTNDATENLICCPLSISAALSMVMLGARGNTEKQISQVLCFGDPDAGAGQQQIQQSGEDNVHALFGDLLGLINDTSAVSIANGLFGEQSFKFLQKYIQDNLKYYNTEPKAMDFKNAAEGARVTINSWVEGKTNDKIKNLLGADTVTRETKLVLVNAIYFNAKWKKPFQANHTSDAVFRVNKNETKIVKMMSQTGNFLFNEMSDGTKVLEMPYKGGDFNMLILLPGDIEDDSTGLERLWLKIRAAGQNQKSDVYNIYEGWTKGMRTEIVDLKLPKFNVEKTYQLNEVLKKMGMVDVFTSHSDLSGMSSTKNLHVSEIVHKAVVAVDEEGTEAAAATGVPVEPHCLNTVQFNADHPFLFFITHVPSKTMVFIGHFYGPE